MHSMSTKLNIFVAIGIGVVIGVVNAGVGDPPTICCTSNFTGTCDVEGAVQFVDATLRLLVENAPEGFWNLLEHIGCSCQNNGPGPETPPWFSCPSVGGQLLIGAYNVQAVLRLLQCHCVCHPADSLDSPCPVPGA